MKSHFEISHIEKYSKILSRDTTTRQELKICFSCERGFCARKGRAKYESVINKPGRYVCKKCADALMDGKENARLRIIDASSS